MTRILVFGDSICAGSDIPDGGPADAWPNLVAADAGLEIANRSRGGRPTASLDEFVPVWDAESALRGPDILLIALGTNDSRDLSTGMVAAAVANIDAMLQHARRSWTGRAILVGPYNINPDALRQTHGIRHERARNLILLNEAYAAYAARSGCGFLPLHGSIPLSCLLADGVHPDRAGNVAIAESALPRLRALL